MRTKSMVMLGVGLAALLGIGWAYATPQTTDAVAESFASYEKVRSLLAGDKIEGLSTEAERLGKAAGSAVDGSQGVLKEHFEAIVKATDKLKDAKELEKARVAFGDISREFLPILLADPSHARSVSE